MKEASCCTDTYQFLAFEGPHETSWICTGAQNRITFDPAQSCADAIGLLRRRVCREDVRVVERGQTSDTRAGPLTFY